MWQWCNVCCSCISSKKESHYQSSVQHFSRQQDGGHRLYQEDDVPMLDIEMDDGGTTAEQEEYEGMDDDNMLLIDDPYTASDVQPQTLASTPAPQDAGLHEDPSLVDSQNINDTNNYNNMCLGRLMQKMIMFLTNRIVIKGRYIVIVFYAGILIASCFLMAQLQPSTHPPQLFRPDTNIQQLLDLKANFSIIDALHCDKCSGLYNVKPSVRQWHSTTTAAYRAPQFPARTTKPPHANNWATVPVLTTTTTTTQSSAHENPKDAQTSGDKTSEGGSDGGQSNQNIDVSDATPLNALKATMLKFLSAFSSSSSTSSPSSSQDGGNKDETGPGTHKKETHTTASSLPAKKVATPPPKPPEPPLPVEKKGETSHQNSYQGNIEKTHPDWFKKTEKSTSVDENFNACKGQSCNDLKDRPMLESGATVFVVFGITGVDMEEDNEGHVMDKFKGKALFDKRFSEAFSIKEFSSDHLRDLCKICHILANHTELVKPGSAQCIPSGMGSLRPALNAIPECQNLTSTRYIYNNQAPANAEGGLDRQGTSLLWLAFAFESTTSEGQAYFEAYKQYEKWEKLMTHIKETVLSPDSPLQSMFQTSEFWTKVLMEVVAVNSAIYGLVLSMVICVITVAVFTGHFMLLLIVVFSILAMICCVVGVFYLANWEMGVVEAISLSILVGSSVDYCVHVVEGFILAGRRMPEEYLKSQPAKALRQQRTSLAVRHIGVAIVCSALTTIMAAIPLTQTYIQPFAKFGSILLINTTVSMVMTLTLAVALLATFGPARYRGSWKSHVLAAVIVAVVLGLSVLCMYIATTQGVDIPGPSGDPLFS